MKILNFLCISTLFVSLFFASTHGAVFDIRNNCPYTVWVAAVPGGGQRLDPGQTWSITVNSKTRGRIWARTGCNFDGSGSGRCQTGDCGGVLQCTSHGQPPNTLAEYALNQFQNVDFFDISLVDGFNVAMDFSPTSGGYRGIQCTDDINGQCPDVLRAPGGCNDPCTVFKTDQYCCNSGGPCEPTDYSRFFKARCPDAYSYPKDDQTSTFTCPGGTNYSVVFCNNYPAVVFDIRNNCPYTVWAAIVPGGGQRLDSGQTWSITVNPGTTRGRIWARTGCNFDDSGRGRCQTGDCGGVLQCTGYGQPPNTLAEYALNQFNNLNFFDISLVDGFNVPMEFSPNSNACRRGIRCTADINGQCPNQLRAPGGCNNPCAVFNTNQYCCNSGNCGPTQYSRFFKIRCPDAYSYPKDDQTSTFTCPGENNYTVVFCP